jgi:hypothetical protein
MVPPIQPINNSGIAKVSRGNFLKLSLVFQAHQINMNRKIKLLTVLTGSTGIRDISVSLYIGPQSGVRLTALCCIVFLLRFLIKKINDLAIKRRHNNFQRGAFFLSDYEKRPKQKQYSGSNILP